MKCGFEVKDENRDELIRIIALHIESTHNIKETPPDMAEKIRKVIKK